MVACIPLGASGWTPLAVGEDPLVRMPGSQPGSTTLVAPTTCLNCHDGYDAQVDPGFHWKGSMMAQSMRDPLFWAAVTVAAQDSIAVLGRPNATDLCLRCHSPSGWLGGRSSPTNGSAMAGSDFDGVSCDTCHRMVDPFFESTHAGTREGNDWSGYWDETDLSATASSAAADATLAVDRTLSATYSFFNGEPFYDASTYAPIASTYLESSGGQLFMSTDSGTKRASFADLNPPHGALYSRFHKSRYFCGSCHDVSNAALQNLAFDGTTPGDGTTVLPSEEDPAHEYFHIERTFSEFLLSDYGIGAGATGSGAFAPEVFTTSRPDNLIATCQDCHMPDRSGAGCDKNSALIRPGESVEHPKSGQPLHDLTGANVWIPWILASTVPTSSNYDATNEMLLSGREAALTMSLTAGEGLDPDALLAGAQRSRSNLQNAASIEWLSYEPGTGEVSFRIVNHTGHKLPTGFPEGRRMFVNVRVWKDGGLLAEVNPYDVTAATLRGLDTGYSPNSPALGMGETHDDALVFEVALSSSVTGEAHSFHVALADARYKDNRIPPKGFRIDEASARLSEPVEAGASALSYFSPAEYAGGYDDVATVVASGGEGVEVRLFYQTTSREYIEFLRDQINGDGSTLEPADYIAGTDPFFDGLRAWGDTIWDLFWHNRDVPGGAPIEMVAATVGIVGDPCALAGSDGSPCSDGSACTSDDTCSGGACVGGSPIVCLGESACRVAGVCNTTTGICEYAPKADGTTCDDGDLCTTLDQCASGSCGGASVVCAALDECHVAGICDALTGLCSNPAEPNGTACTGGLCQEGVCTADPGPVDAGVTDAGVTDAGVTDAGVAGDGSITDGGPSDPPAGGCGCRVVGRTDVPMSTAIVLMLGLLVLLRRRGREWARARR